MCVTAKPGIMGCGKSRHHSPDISEHELKGQGNYTESKPSYSKNPKKKKHANQADKGRKSKETSRSSKKESNGKNKCGDGLNSTGTSSSISSSRSCATSSLQVDSDKSNGATKPQDTYYLLEVPNEIYTAETASRTIGKEVKTGSKPTKCVHATTSQLEFFKMLDEKIEMGTDYQTSNETPDNSLQSESRKQ